VKKAFSAVFLAAGLAGCGATPMEVRNEKELQLPPGEGAFGGTLTWEWRRKDTIPPEATTATPAAAAVPAAAASGSPAQATAAEQDDFKKWRESASSTERSEFEEWRAWQEWKRKNPK